MRDDATPSSHVQSNWRRHAAALLLAVLAACGGEDSALESVGLDGAEVGQRQDALGEVRLRLVAANTSSGNGQDYDPGHGIRIFQGTDADVVMIQEFNYKSNSAADLRGFVDTAFGTQFHYYREGGAQIPNGIISRYPIIASGEWDDPYVSNRDFAWARIDVPGPKDLWAVSVHLLTTSSGSRNSEASSLVSRIKANIPAGDYLVIGGDLNTGSRNESAFGTLSQVVRTAGPHPADKNGNTNTNAGRNSPYDHVLVDNDLFAYQTPVVIGGSTFTNGLVVDTRVYSPLSDIAPALSGDSGASGMQHMAVIKDFIIPGDSSPGNNASVTVTSPTGGESWAGGSVRNITWTSTSVTNVKLEYTLNGSTWSTLAASTAASAGSYAWTVPSSATTTARVRISDASNASVSNTSNAAFTITTAPAGGTGNVIINEVMVNEPGSNVAGEFVELVNTGTGAVDLSGWTVSDAASLRHTFPGGTSLAAGGVIVVFGGAAGIPAGTPNAVSASTGTLGLSNSGDTVTVKTAAGTVVESAVLSSGVSGTDGVSANRSPDLGATATFVLHTSLSSLQASPGRRVNGSAF
ncbi:lamin tail domain-containing protein [Myxococcus xanthus]|uniref:lamin tail domain-containing protein n=1 Tax=Myxococcus xanthus TaxID=34 RepID=UPI00112748C0|nr:lamin tail domain-containing protein [Myxococcus xanthus]QDE81465.1 endonuclease [Myxococcus xanthus]QDF03103.1 endonuclease [Myxococcus xanthus]